MKVTHCSVSEAYVVYSLVEETKELVIEGATAPYLQRNDGEIAKQTLVVVIDLKKREELVLKNPS